MTGKENIILELRNISKSFGNIHALKGVQFTLEKGQVHALMGENGAGKSTLIKVITGAHRQDNGSIIIDGEELVLNSPADAMKKGIACIYQHNTSFPDLTVTENIFMGHEIYTKLKTYNWRAMHKKAHELLAPRTNTINVKNQMSALSVAQRQLVAIATAISQNARIIIMDEPTSALTTSECRELYDTVRRLRDRGISIIFITHKFEDMYAIASHVTVLRDGEYIGNWEIDQISNEDLIEAMVGRKLKQMYPTKTAVVQDEVALDGVKRRVRAGMGRCQGGFCTPRITEILAKERGVDITQVCKNIAGSELLTGRMGEDD